MNKYFDNYSDAEKGQIVFNSHKNCGKRLFRVLKIRSNDNLYLEIKNRF